MSYPVSCTALLVRLDQKIINLAHMIEACWRIDAASTDRDRLVLVFAAPSYNHGATYRIELSDSDARAVWAHLASLAWDAHGEGGVR